MRRCPWQILPRDGRKLISCSLLLCDGLAKIRLLVLSLEDPRINSYIKDPFSNDVRSDKYEGKATYINLI